MGTMDLRETIEIADEGGLIRVSLGGNITVESDLSSIAEIQAERVVLDLAGLGRMTSAGVAHWMEMIQALCANAQHVQIENATHGFIQQYAMVHGFAACARVESFCATYSCTRCGDQKVAVLERSTDFPDGYLRDPTPPQCDRCSVAMEGDDLLFELDVRL